VPWSFKFIDKELQTQVHASAAGPNPVAQKWKKNEKMLNQDTTGTGSALGFNFIEKELQMQVYPSAAGPYLVAQKWKKKLKWYSPKTLPVPAVLWGFKLIEEKLQTRAHQSATGLILWLKNEKNNFKLYSPKILPVPAVSRGLQIHSQELAITSPSNSHWVAHICFKFIHTYLQTRAHQSVANQFRIRR
jgi:hypothetical protein